MEKVKDLVLYQVATDRHFKVGDKIYFGDENNRLAYRMYNNKFNEGKSMTRMAYDYLASENNIKDKDLILKLGKALAESDFVIRELAMENVRKEIAPDAPSRLKCMFLTSTKENVLNTLSHFSVYTVGQFFQGVAVKLNGIIFVAKKSVGRKGLSYSEYANLARDYWKQEAVYTDNPDEILFVGDAKIIEVFKEMERPAGI